ncbi:MAG: hypothetical protein ACK41T_13030 [Pseudobdellovibrio sp.]
MTLEYVLLLAMTVMILFPALMRAPKEGFTLGSKRLGARVETQLATGHGFQPYYTGSGSSGGDSGKVPWAKQD